MKRSKYGSKKATRIIGKNQYSFDSQKEARHFDKLYAMAQRGLIEELALQPSYDLIPKQSWNGKTLRKITYRADFRYIKNGKTYVVDAKGMLTDVYKIKMRLFLLQNPDVIFVEV